MSDADAADTEGFLGDLLLCLPVVGVNLFEKAKVDATHSRELILKAKGIEARGVDGSEGFVVRAGSRAVKAAVPSCHAFLVDLRQSLVEQGVLAPDGDSSERYYSCPDSKEWRILWQRAKPSRSLIEKNQ